KSFMAEPRPFLKQLEATQSPVVKFRLAHMKVYYLTSPEATLHVMQRKHQNYYKGGPSMNIGRKTMGNGLVFSDDDFWKRQRRIANPAFHTDCLNYYTEVMQGRTQDMVNNLQARAKLGEVNMYDHFNQLAIEIVKDNLFGGSLSDLEMDVMLRSINYLLEEMSKHIRTGFMLPFWIPTASNRKMLKAMRESEEIVTNLFRNKANEKEQGHTLLDMLIHTPDPETGEHMSPQQIADEIKIFFLAGTDTSANVMSFLAFELANHRDIQAKVRAEVKEVLGDRAPSMADCKQLAYTQTVIKEALRRYAPGWMVSRSAKEADTIEGIDIPKGAQLFVSPLMMHHHPDYWENPDKFDPDRWSPERKDRNNSKAFMPFTVGPRKCIGSRFAELEITIAIAMLMQQFELQPSKVRTAEVEYSGTLRPKEGQLPLRLIPLKKEEPIPAVF
ncbi:MAG: cytochrome P450, partial [Bacteroidota bacterium]